MPRSGHSLGPGRDNELPRHRSGRGGRSRNRRQHRHHRRPRAGHNRHRRPLRCPGACRHPQPHHHLRWLQKRNSKRPCRHGHHHSPTFQRDSQRRGGYPEPCAHTPDTSGCLAGKSRRNRPQAGHPGTSRSSQHHPRRLGHQGRRRLRRRKNKHARFPERKRGRARERHPRERHGRRMGVLEQLGRPGRCGIQHPDTARPRRSRSLSSVDRRHHQHNHPEPRRRARRQRVVRATVTSRAPTSTPTTIL